MEAGQIRTVCGHSGSEAGQVRSGQRQVRSGQPAGRAGTETGQDQVRNRSDQDSLRSERVGGRSDQAPPVAKYTRTHTGNACGNGRRLPGEQLSVAWRKQRS